MTTFTEKLTGKTKSQPKLTIDETVSKYGQAFVKVDARGRLLGITSEYPGSSLGVRRYDDSRCNPQRCR